MPVVAVLGAGGFIGRHVVDELARRGNTVLACSRQPLPMLPNGVSWRQADLDDAIQIPSGAVVIHLAEPFSASGPDHATLILARLERVLATDLSRLIYVSSAVVYGDEATAPLAETVTAQPRGAYADAKVATEQRALRDGRSTVVRLSNVYGPGMAPINVVSDILAQVGGSGPLRLRDLAPVRDYLHVSDAARAFGELAARSPGGVLNIATGTGTSVEQLARVACVAANQPHRVLEATQPAGRSSYLVLDPSRARERIGWVPMISVDAGMTALVQERMQ